MVNLIENAVAKYNPPVAGDVSSDRARDRIIISVSDSGVGDEAAPAANRRAVFYRVEKSAPGIRGHRLGLAIVNSISSG